MYISQKRSVLQQLGTFLPCYAFVCGDRCAAFRRYGKCLVLEATVLGMTASTIDAITDVPTAILALVTLAVLWRKKIPEPFIVLGAAIIGLVAYSGLHH